MIAVHGPRRLVLAYDTETTGLPLFDQPSDDERQPHLVQVGAILACMDTGEVMAQLSLIGRPDDWVIPDEVAAIHGITTEKALRVGLPERFLLDTLWVMWEQADLRIGYNEAFDARIIRIATKRYYPQEGTFGDLSAADFWKQGPAECAMKLASTAMKGTKRSTLAVAHQTILGRPLDNAHDALADARGALDLWLHLADRTAPPGTRKEADGVLRVPPPANDADTGKKSRPKGKKAPPVEIKAPDDTDEVPFL